MKNSNRNKLKADTLEAPVSIPGKLRGGIERFLKGEDGERGKGKGKRARGKGEGKSGKGKVGRGKDEGEKGKGKRGKGNGKKETTGKGMKKGDR